MAPALRARAATVTSLRPLPGARPLPPYDGMASAIVIGMPQLCLGGLSETWLLKDIGHRHWTLLAHALGKTLPEFEDEHGAAIHAAFNAVSLRHGDLRAVKANGVLEVTGDLTRLSNTQFRSLHRVTTAGRLVAEVEVISVFVRRMVPGVNRSASAAAPRGLPPLIHRPEPAGFAAAASALRAGRWTEHFGLARSAGRSLTELAIDPCPSQDYNGAGFLYCAMFQAFVDRAEWAFFRLSGAPAATRRRDIIYRGNIEPGDRVAVILMAVLRDEGTLTHWCRLRRQGGGEPLADIFTDRVVAPP